MSKLSRLRTRTVRTSVQRSNQEMVVELSFLYTLSVVNLEVFVRVSN